MASSPETTDLPDLRAAYIAACEALHSAVQAITAAEARRDAALCEMERLEKEMDRAG